MKSNNQTIPFYTTVLAKLLKEWREKNLVTVYVVAKAINASPHTITRFEQLKGGVSLEVGLRYLEYAEEHVSNPDIVNKFRAVIAKHKTEEEQQLYLIDLEHKEQLAMRRKQEEQKRIEERICKSVTKEIEEKHISDIRLLNDEKQMLADKIAKLEQENIALKNVSQNISSDNQTKESCLSKLKNFLNK